MIPTPIRHVLSTIRTHQAQALLMGGQACVLYGTAQFSKDIDFLILASPENFRQMRFALDALDARRIAVPPFDPEALARGHAVHFRCQAPEACGLRIDVMTRLRDLPPFPDLWERRTTIHDQTGWEIHMLSVPDLVQAKKTQRSKDWPMIEALVEEHLQAHSDHPTPDFVTFWLTESRTAERLVELVARFPRESEALLASRPLLSLACENSLPALREALDAEVRAEQEKDRIYWEPLKRELDEFRRNA